MFFVQWHFESTPRHVDAGRACPMKWSFSQELADHRWSWGKGRFPKQLAGVIGSSNLTRHGDEHRLLLNWVSWACTAVTALAGEGKGCSPLVFYPQTHFVLLEVAKSKIHIASEMPLTETGLQDPAPSLDTAQNVGWQRGKCSFVQREESAGSMPACTAGSATPKNISRWKITDSFCKVTAYYNIIVQPSWRRAEKLFRLLMNRWKRGVL